MRDLELWRSLHDGTVTAAQLRALAELPVARRAPFFTHVVQLADGAPDPALRAAALTAIGGARGVPAVEALVAALDDADAEVRAAALESLRQTGRDAPYRLTHALFHPDVDVRRAALALELPHHAARLATYLRGDPACAEAASRFPWPEQSLSLAFDLHARGSITPVTLVELVLRTPVASVRAFLEAEHGRSPEVVEDYLDEAVRSPTPVVAPGVDALDTLVSALDAAGLERSYEHVIEAVTPRKQRRITRRAAAAMLSYASGRPATAQLVGACVALEPRLLGAASFPRDRVDAAVHGLIGFRWPVRPTVPQVERLLALPLMRRDDGSPDLALAAALAGLLPHRRLGQLADLVGEAAIVTALVAGDRGWDELCRLPPEKPAPELAWLGKVERQSEARHIALSARTLAIFPGARLEAFVEQLPRRSRHATFLSFAAGLGAGTVTAGPLQLAAVCKAVATRVERGQVATILATLLGPVTRLVTGPDRSVGLAADGSPDLRSDGGGLPSVGRGGDASGFGAPLAVELVRRLADKLFLGAVAELDDVSLLRLIEACDAAGGLLWSRELALAGAVGGRAHPQVRAWAEEILRAASSRPTVNAPVLRTRTVLARAHRDAIATCADAALDRALAPALEAPSAGLCAALAARATATPSPMACAALLGSVDPVEEVARQLDRYAGSGPHWDDELDAAAAIWQGVVELPALAHARLYRWEAHTFALLRWTEDARGLRSALELADALPGQLASHTLWKGLAELAMFLRYRDRPRLVKEDPATLAWFAADRLDGVHGRHAARLLVALLEGGLLAMSPRLREHILDRAADADVVTRDSLARIVRVEGLPEPPPVERQPPPARELVATLRQSTDLDALVRWCRDARPPVVEEAALRLVVLGADGQARLAALLAEIEALPAPLPILASIELWDSPAALASARTLAGVAALPPSWQFHLCVGLCAAGDASMLPGALAALSTPVVDERSWFRRQDWATLTRVADPLVCAIALADSPHHHAYGPSIAILLERTEPAEVGDALARFLAVDDERPLLLRRQVARRLATPWADLSGLPVLVSELADEGVTDWEGWAKTVPPASLGPLIEAIVGAAIDGGPCVCSEKRLLAILAQLRTTLHLPIEILVPSYRRMLLEGTTAAARRAAATFATDALTADDRLQHVAEVFAWGVRRGVELTGKLYKIHMTGKEREYGHTRLDSARIFVTPLPLLRGEMYGQDVVEGLILHELGHHVYHAGADNQTYWKRATDEGLFPLLNLVADEHLERNLRGVEPEYGDRLKRLGAYAFQHATQEVSVPVLLASLRGSAAPALIGADLAVAFDEDAVRLRRGAVLTALDRVGHPLARFCRALRLGLGNRARDPLVARALELCTGIRRLDMKGLYELTRALADLFGSAAAVAAVFGGPEGMVFGEREDDVFGAGIEDDKLQKEVERILDPKQHKGSRDRARGGGKLAINVNESERFDKIAKVERMRSNPAAHRLLVHQVNRHAVRLRAFLDDLGLRWLPARARLSGRALDRTRLRALVTRNDPRILVARTPVRKTDLFLGTVIDCSGSMSSADNIERARRFAVLIAEAVRPLAGVEARFFGFTDSVIYDAGDATDCAVTALVANGGNNDAAALFHVAQVAAASTKRAKVLVMISDGLPTECSVAALRGLVRELTRRRGMVCAQVAVRPLEEVCFPHYVVLDDGNPDIAVARFGRMIADLARRVLAS